MHLIIVFRTRLFFYYVDCLNFQGAVIGIDDEDDSTFTITVDQKTFHFQGTLSGLFCVEYFVFYNLPHQTSN